MDIHKPKPWHNLREFLTEIGTIIVGILIALSLEQAVEWLHGRELGRQADADLAEGLQRDLLNSAQVWAVAPCDQARIRELAELLSRPGGAWKANPTTMPFGGRALPAAFRQPGFLWSHSAWEAAVGSGVLIHMPRDRVAKYAEAYRLVELNRDRQKASTEASFATAALAYDRALTEAEKAQYLNALGAVDDYIAGAVSGSVRLLQDAQGLGIALDHKTLAPLLQRQRNLRGACVRDFPDRLPER